MKKNKDTQEIAELRKKHEELNAQKDELISKKESVIKKHESNEQAMATHIANARQLEKNVHQAEKQEIRGDISAEKLEEVRSTFKNAVAAFEQAEKTRHLAGQVIQEIDREIREKDGRKKIVLRKICNSIRSDMESELKPEEIRKKLVQIYTSRTLTDGGNVEWFRLVMSYFPAPDTPEAKEAKEEFLKKNNLA